MGVDDLDEPFQPRSNLGLYLLTAVVGLLLLADLWPPLAAWLVGLGLELPTWPGREVFTVPAAAEQRVRQTPADPPPAPASRRRARG